MFDYNRFGVGEDIYGMCATTDECRVIFSASAPCAVFVDGVDNGVMDAGFVARKNLLMSVGPHTVTCVYLDGSKSDTTFVTEEGGAYILGNFANDEIARLSYYEKAALLTSQTVVTPPPPPVVAPPPVVETPPIVEQPIVLTEQPPAPRKREGSILPLAAVAVGAYLLIKG